MVDANQGWRMPGDLEPRWDVATAAQCARALEPLGVYWLEEPLRTDDLEGYAALRRLTSLRLAAGEMARSAQEARDLVLRGGVDVVQTDVVLVARDRRLPADRRARRSRRPRLVAAHVVERLRARRQPPPRARRLDGAVHRGAVRPAGWSAERRDWLLPTPLEIAEDGTIAPPPGPGLGVTPDFDALERWRVG